MQKITLKPAVEEDAKFLYKMMQDKEYLKYYPLRLAASDLEDQKRKIRHYEAQAKKGTGFFFIIMLGKENAGLIDIYKIMKEDRRGSIGYGVEREHWGKGIATKAIKQGLKFMKNEMRLHACEAVTDPKNKASKKVLENCGFEKVGVVKDYYYQNNKYLDKELYWKIL